MEVTITVKDPSAELLEFLAPLLGGAKVVKTSSGGKAASVKEVKKEEDEDFDLGEDEVTLDDLKAAMSAKLALNKTAECKKLLAKYNVKGISGLEEDQRAAFLKELKAIK